MTSHRPYSAWSHKELVTALERLAPLAGQDTPSGSATDKGQVVTDEAVSTGSASTRKRLREFDYDRYGEVKIALRIAYFGWPYHGLAVQDHDEETIEGHLFRALITAKLIRDRTSCDFTRCGRTDKGVSAFGQVVSLIVRTAERKQPGDATAKRPKGFVTDDTTIATTTSNSTTNSDGSEHMPYATILNRLLPENIRVLSWAPVDRSFDARFSCLSRTYRYYFSPHRRHLDRMREAAAMFVGVHDFRNFCKADRSQDAPNFVRRIYSFDIVPISNDQSGLWAAQIVGKAFLWHQIRCMMAVLFAVADGFESPSVVAEMLDVDRVPAKPIYDMASDLPLVLYDCTFEDVHFMPTQDDMQRLEAHLTRLWHDRQVMATMTQDLLLCVGEYHVSRPLPPTNSPIKWSSIKSQPTYAPATTARSYVRLLERPRERAYPREPVTTRDDEGE